MSVYTHYPVPLTITCLTASPGDNKLEDNARIKDDELAGGPPRIIYLGISGCTQAITPPTELHRKLTLSSLDQGTSGEMFSIWVHVICRYGLSSEHGGDFSDSDWLPVSALVSALPACVAGYCEDVSNIFSLEILHLIVRLVCWSAQCPVLWQNILEG